MVRFAISDTALKTRSIPKSLERTPRGAAYVRRGKYVNDLMRLDDLILDAIDDERDLDDAERVVTRKNMIGRTVLTDEFTRDYLLAQELLLAVHNAVEQLRQNADDDEKKINVIVHYRNGNFLWESDSQEGVSLRFTVIYQDGTTEESFAYINNGTYYLTRLSPVGEEVVGALDADTRDWPQYTDIEVSEGKRIIAIDESLSRFAGNYVTSHSGDTLGGRTWMDSDENIHDFHQRVLPDPEKDSVEDPMDQISARSMFVANYGGFEAVLLSLAGVLLASVAWQSGAWWTAIPLLLTLLLAVAIGVIFQRIAMSMLRVDLVRKIEKPLPHVWRAANVLRVLFVPVYTFLAMTAMSMITLRGKGMEIEDFHANSYTYTQTLAVLFAIGCWLLVSRRIPPMSKYQLVTPSMRRFSAKLDIVVGAVMMVTAAVLADAENSNADRLTFLALSIALFIGLTLGTWFFSRVVGAALQPLRSLKHSTCTHYVHSDRGMSREDWASKNGVLL